jgi:hypothetical protein
VEEIAVPVGVKINPLDPGTSCPGGSHHSYRCHFAETGFTVDLSIVRAIAESHSSIPQGTSRSLSGFVEHDYRRRCPEFDCDFQFRFKRVDTSKWVVATKPENVTHVGLVCRLIPNQVARTSDTSRALQQGGSPGLFTVSSGVLSLTPSPVPSRFERSNLPPSFMMAIDSLITVDPDATPTLAHKVLAQVAKQMHGPSESINFRAIQKYLNESHSSWMRLRNGPGPSTPSTTSSSSLLVVAI